MKKCVLILFVLMFLTGCKKTYLTCSRTVVDDQSIKVEETIKLGYKRKQLHTSDMYLDYTFKGNSNMNEENLKKELLSECERYKDIKGVKCSVYNIDNKLRFELSLTVEDISKEDYTNFENMLDYGNYTNSFRKLEKEYSCK